MYDLREDYIYVNNGSKAYFWQEEDGRIVLGFFLFL